MIMCVRDSIHNKTHRTLTLDRDVSRKLDEKFGSGNVSKNVNKILRQYLGFLN